MAIGKRIEETLQHLGKRQSWLAGRSGVEPGSIHAIIKRDGQRSEFVPQLADALGVNERWLSNGEGPQWKHANAMHSDVASYDNLVPVELRFQPVPIISTIKAGELHDSSTQYQPGEGDVFVRPRLKKLGPRAWAHEVDGWSMFDGTEDGIKPGHIIFCDPDLAYFPNSYVIAKQVGSQQATFKQLVYDEGRWLLRPLNRDTNTYPIIPIDDPELRVIAVVTEAQAPPKKLI